MASWTYSDWNTLDHGTTARRDRLSAHIKEVSEALRNTNYAVAQKSHTAALERYLDRLMQAMSEEFGTTAPVDAPSTVSAPFIRGIARR